MRTAVIGAGGAGTIHAQGYARLAAEGVRLVGVCDVAEERARALGERLGVPWFTDAGSLLAATQPDLVSVATREHQHVEPTLEALRSGAHVLCEKIMAHSLRLGEEMVAAARGAGRVLAVNYNYRQLPSVAWLAESLRSGKLGPVRLVTIHADAFGWHHALDLLRYLMGEDPVEVTAQLVERQELRAYPWAYTEELLYIPSRAATAVWRFPSAAQAALSATQGDLADFIIHDLTVVTDRARVTVRDMTLADAAGRVEAYGTEPPAAQPCSLEEAFYRSIAAVVKALREGRPVPTSGEDGLRVMAMEAAVVAAHRAGSRQPVPRLGEL